MYRAKYIFLLPNIKSVQQNIIKKKFTIAVDALNKEDKFLKYIGEEEWPTEMDLAKKKSPSNYTV